MNRADLIYMLNFSGVLPPCHGATENQFCAFERFAELVAETERNRTWTQEHWTEYERSIAAAEREACAKVCEPQSDHDDPLTAFKIAAAIRVRGQV